MLKENLYIVFSFHIIGPYFYEGNVNGRNYLAMINDYVVPLLYQRYGQLARGQIPPSVVVSRWSPSTQAQRSLCKVARPLPTEGCVHWS